MGEYVRIAAIDIGSDTVHILIADVSEGSRSSAVALGPTLMAPDIQPPQSREAVDLDLVSQLESVGPTPDATPTPWRPRLVEHRSHGWYNSAEERASVAPTPPAIRTCPFFNSVAVKPARAVDIDPAGRKVPVLGSYNSADESEVLL